MVQSHFIANWEIFQKILMISSHPTMGFATTVQWVSALGLVLHCGSRSRADLQAPCRWVRSDGSRPICKGLAPFSGGRCCDTWGRVRTPDIAAARPCVQPSCICRSVTPPPPVSGGSQLLFTVAGVHSGNTRRADARCRSVKH